MKTGTGFVWAALISLMTLSIPVHAEDPAYPPQWDSLPVTDLMRIAYETYGEGGSGATGRLQMAACLESRFLSSAEAARGATPPQWRQLTLRLGPTLSAERRSIWAARLKEAFAAPDVLSSLPPVDVLWLAEALGQLDEAAGCKSLVDGLAASRGLASLNGEALARLSAVLASMGEEGKPGQTALVEHVTGTYAADANAARAVTPAQWQQIVSNLRAPLSASAATKTSWAAALRAAYAADAQAIRAWDPQQAWCLMEALQVLGDANREAAAVTWLEAQPNLAAMSHYDVRKTVISGLPSRAIRQASTQRYETSLLEAADPPPFLVCMGMAHLWFGALDDEVKAREWAMRAYQTRVGSAAARETAKVEELMFLSGLLGTCHIVEEGTAYPAYVEALRLRIIGDELPDNLNWAACWQLAMGLCSPEARAAVRQDLLDAQGQPRAAAIMILSSAYGFASEKASWQAYLDEQIAQSSGDAKAKWFLGRATLASVMERGRYAALQGRQHLDRAMASAESPALRTTALSHLAWVLAHEGKADEMAALLDSVAGQFAETDKVAVLDELRYRSALDHKVNQQKAQQVQADVARHRAEAWRAELERRIDAAQAKGDREETTRLQRLLGLP